MFKIALVQNLSELRNYSYADLRGVLHKMNFEVLNVTRENLQDLEEALEMGTDCVLFASNSLNDGNIYEYVCTDAFQKAFDAYLENGGATLVMHQNNLKEKDDPLPFLGGRVHRIEKNYAGENVTLRKCEKFAEQYYVFPNKVTVEQISENCFRNPAVSGNYWQLMRPECEDWTPILQDDYGNAVIQASISRKIIISSLLLDYQKHNDLLQNVLINLMVDNMSLAILESETPDTLGFSYFLNSLENNKLYYKRYADDPQSIQDLLDNIRLGIHSAILVNNKMMEKMDVEIVNSINQYGVKLIQIKDQNEDRPDSFVVHSVDKSVSLLFSKIELKIQEELSTGFISGSFMKTIEVLTKLREFQKKGMTNAKYNKDSITHVLELISPHMNEDGSYDKTFGATCKVLWLFAEFLGKDDRLTKASYQYIRNNKNIDSLREKLERYFILSKFEKDRQRYLADHCSALIDEAIASDFAFVTEYDFLTILKVALLIGDERMLMDLFAYIKSHTDVHGEFFNCYVTANATSSLLQMYDCVRDERSRDRIRRLLFETVIYLRQVDTRTMSIEEVLQVVCALYQFESVVSFPVSDLTELIFKTGTFPHDYHVFEKEISNYQRSRLEIDNVMSINQSMQKENNILKRYKTGFFVLLSLLAIHIYLLVYVVIAFKNSGVPVAETVISEITESWPSLFSLLIVPLISFTYNRYLKKREDK